MVNFTLEPKRRYSTECPSCSKFRDKKGTKTLQVFRDPDGKIRWQCMHAGQCELNERQWAPDPSPHDIEELPDEDTYAQTMDANLCETTKFEGPVYWYRNSRKEILFGVMRKDYTDRKLYVPVRQLRYTTKIVFGKGITYPKGKFLFGAETLEDKSKVLVVEGEKAALAGQKLFPAIAVVSWRGGAQAITNGDWSLLSGKTVFLWPDNDEPGKAAMEKIKDLIEGAEVYLVDVSNMPPKSDIADDIDPAILVEAVHKATLIKENKASGWMSFDKLLVQDELLNKRIPFGWEVVDKEVSWPASGVVVLEGRTKHGKTAAGINLSLQLLLRNLKVVYFSYEIPASRVLSRFARALNYEIPHSEVFKSKEMSWLKDKIGDELKIYDQSSQLDLNDLGRLLDDPSLNNSIVVIDYAQIVPLPTNVDRHVALKGLMDKCRVLSNKHGFIVLMMSQLTPNYDNPLYDAPREAKDIHFGAEMVLRVWYKANEFPHPVYESVPGNFVLHVLLNRDGESGQQFGCAFFNGSYIEPNGKVVHGVTHIKKKDRVADALEAFLGMQQTSVLLGGR